LVTVIEEAAMDKPTLPWDGECRCGALRFKVTKPPMLTGACHCTGCQRMTGSAYSLTVTVPADGFEVTKGEPVLGGLRGPVAHHHHCPQCLSWVFTRAEGMDWFVNIRATMLDDPGWFEPYIELWTSERLPWATTSARRSFERDPQMTEWNALIEAYAEEGQRP
jgi:hypothetical protein